MKPAKLPKVEPGAAKVDLGVIDISDDDEDADVLQVNSIVLTFLPALEYECYVLYRAACDESSTTEPRKSKG